ncbi:lovastatin nonaketide synthase [Aspergillus steynii IBT 23096]|uniref:Lovastatin nonaketide synthase n=1 Tax=Aspergillus steynii IBT 23096 TaxID=1392250 RepID=A0A2I2G0E6_9EURO|nr:lovastatin nonaketide synthase [Aspergillus steynii IBT 23096]PLB46349.1 lovastatin nonaketide synthase [Aspergillus steynii IBT 23096]
MYSSQSEPIAIVGSGCRFPGGSLSPSKLWQLLREPRDVSREIPDDRFSTQGYYHPDGSHHGTTHTTRSYLLDDVRQFDPQFFNIQPAEAEAIDPQQRLLLETVYESIESAGMTLEGLQGTQAAVFVGLMGCDYSDIVLGDLECAPTYTGTGTARSIHSNRISYFFDWHGPSMTVDTACSSSMMAVHLAAQALRSGDAPVAVAAGASLNIGPNNYVLLSNLGMISPDSRSKMWDAEANGYARGEGVGVVILKTLSQALKDGDHVESLIREVCVNQDGRTQGITMPNELAQAALIRQTYQRAGLDPTNATDRPQYFEAHGTGTPAGDPREAEAISRTFFPEGCGASQDEIIYVGSIKTIIGHTEGAAGIASILKASLALQNGYIPPNLLFNRLSSSVARFTEHLQVPTSLIPWPQVADGGVRRASVNSFGFGGSNGHAILESFQPESRTTSHPGKGKVVLTPFIFSAASERSLVAVLKAYAQHLGALDDVDLRSLAYTLHSRRSVLPFRVAIWANSLQDLLFKIDERLDDFAAKQTLSLGVRALSKSNRKILGVFTGQGAQWAGMGKQFLIHLPYAHQIICELDASLASLPLEHRPSWTLLGQLLTDPAPSRVHEAAISQPICTAVQVLLVCLLRSAGVHFGAVVGHSSGEIGAAYAAGMLSASDAVRIAYYRGFGASLSGGQNQEKGAMLAVGASLEEATDLCKLHGIKDRVTVAACNSPSSVTLSGDIDAIKTAKLVLDDERKFSRMLRVDTAYHSHHMIPCAGPYMEFLRQCGIKPTIPGPTAPSWYSSVNTSTEPMHLTDSLAIEYWKDNMVQPVLFSQAVETALASAGPFDIALEVGPHPALQGPFNQIIEEVSKSNIPYSGSLKRGSDDIEAFANALGFVWAHLGLSAVNFKAYEQALLPQDEDELFLKDLPTYPWNHEGSYWFESRITRVQRERKRPVHPLLGIQASDKTDSEVKWRNFLKKNELPWLNDHQIQGQAVFPAAGYVCMAWEAVMEVSGARPTRLFEIHNMSIGRAIVFDRSLVGVEVVFALSNIARDNDDPGFLRADFSCHSCSSRDNNLLILNACGTITVFYGDPGADSLPAESPEVPNLVDVDADSLYDSLTDLGYRYTGLFKIIDSLKRKRNHARGRLQRVSTNLLIHPAIVDGGLQALLAATSYPGDGALWSLHMPVTVRNIRLNPYFCHLSQNEMPVFEFDAIVSDFGSFGSNGSVQVYPPGSSHALLQIEGAKAVPVAPATAKDDRNIFSEVILDRLSLDGEWISEGHVASPEEYHLGYLLERIAHYYLRQLHERVTAQEREQAEFHHQRLLVFAENIVTSVASGQHDWAKQEWAQDTKSDILEASERYSHLIDIRMMTSIGENLLSVVRGESTYLEHMVRDNMLEEFYCHSLGFPVMNKWLARMAKQLVHQYPSMKILEIGAGTGGATKLIFKAIGRKFSSYTYTDVSPAYFDRAKEDFREFTSKMEYKILDLEKDMSEQGYTEGEFDLVVASNVLHATKNLEHTLRRVRGLLRPGGHLLMLEITSTSPMRFGFFMGGLPGWWVGHDDGRQMAPVIEPVRWHSLLRKSGFSGIEAITPASDILPYPMSVMAAQADDYRIQFLRDPAFEPIPQASPGALLIVGTESLVTTKLAEKISRILANKFAHIAVFSSIEYLGRPGVRIPRNVISLCDLDEPTFLHMSQERLSALQLLVNNAKNILWVTQGSQGEEPYNNMSIGFTRSLRYEIPDMRLQVLDTDSINTLDAQYISNLLLILSATDSWARLGEMDDVLWGIEPEIHLKQGSAYIPRIIQDRPRNDRYNSKQRPLSKQVCPGEQPVFLDVSGDFYVLREFAPSSIFTTMPASLVKVKVATATINAVQAGSFGAAFIAYGTVEATSEPVVVFSDKNASILEVPEKYVVRYEVDPSKQHVFLQATMLELIADNILSLCQSDGDLLLYRTPEPLSPVVQRRAIETGRRVFEVTHGPEKGTSMVSIHLRALESHIRSALPKNLAAFVNFSVDTTEVDFARRVLSNLRVECRIIGPDRVYQQAASLVSEYAVDNFHSALKRAASHAAEILDRTQLPPIEVITLHESLEMRRASHKYQIIDWTVDSTVGVRIESASNQVALHPDKSYLLVGLTADLGQAVCEWMIDHGARSVVLLSRNPRVGQRWLDLQARKGATVTVYSADVSDRQSIGEVHRQIAASLPAVAGVVNAAMVLQDSMFSNTNLDMLRAVMAPKVDGSRYLDELFSDPTLDFFILFSSLAWAGGNSGQSVYAAANGYLVGLAAQRRNRGLPASVIDLGPVLGLGYITRSGQITAADIDASGSYPISEYDLLEHVAEAVLASPIQSTASYEIISGIREVDPELSDRVNWINNPKLSHFVVDKGDVKADTADKRAMPIKDQLREAQTVAELRQIITNGFTARLLLLLQLPANSMSTEVPLVELGVDSLVAVEVRSWFLKNVSVDLPVLKVLGGSSLLDVVEISLEQASPKLLAQTSGVEGMLEDGNVSSVERSKHPHAEILTDRSTEGSWSPPSTGQVEQSSYRDDSKMTPLSTPHSEQSEMHFHPIIERTEKMSFTQRRFWFMHHHLADPTTFNVTFSHHLEGEMHVADMAQALVALGAKHEGLRTCFFDTRSENSQPIQAVLAQSLLHLEHRHIETADVVDTEFKKLVNHVYNLENGDVMKVILLTHTPRSHFLIIGYHHIAMDGIGFAGFLQELMQIRTAASSPMQYQYIDYSNKQRQAYEQGDMAGEIEFWRKEISNPPPPLPLLPFARAKHRRALREYSHSTSSFRLSSIVTARIKRKCRSYQATSFHFYLAVLKTMLFKMLDSDDLCIGIADSNRTDGDMLRTMGAFLNPLPLRFRRDMRQSFGDAVRTARQKVYSAMEHARLPFDVLLDELKIPRSADHSPLFQVFLEFRQGVQEQMVVGDWQVQRTHWDYGKTPYDIMLDIIENTSGEAVVSLSTQRSLYSQKDTDLLGRVFQNLLDTFASNPAQRVGDPQLFARADINKAITAGIGPHVPTTWPANVADCIGISLSAGPDKIALKNEGGIELTYRELSDRADRIAAAVKHANIQQGSRVAIFLEPGTDQVASMIAMFRLGTVYVPLDLRQPVTRLKSLLKDCEPSAVLYHAATSGTVGSLLPSDTSKLLDISRVDAAKPSPSCFAPVGGHSPAMVLYTSGSTGEPKGIVISHSNICHHLESMSQTLGFGAEVMLHQSSPTFDLAVSQVLMALCHGGTLVIVPQAKRGDVLEITKIMAEQRVTSTVATPSEYSAWLRYGCVHLDSCPTWTLALSGGEQLTSRLIHEFDVMRTCSPQVVNIYGPAEITISSNCLTVPGVETAGAIPVGPTLPNYSICIVDQNMEPLPIGMSGEICIGGCGVTLGYLNNDSLTQQKYVTNPFASESYRARGWTRMVRTGDRGRLSNDGSLAFEGRMGDDSIVKLHGIRVELEDIEIMILRQADGGIDQVVVSVRGDPQFLVAHVILSRTLADVDQSAFLEDLRSSLPLPLYMCPAILVSVTEFPFNAHFKADRLAIAKLPLPSTVPRSPGTGFDLTGLQKQLKDLWDEVLPQELIDISAAHPDLNFFQAGGNSFLLLKIQDLIRKRFRVTLSLADLYEASTLGRASIQHITPAAPVQSSPRRNNNGLVVVMTGSTGALGFELLRQLVGEARVSRIHCVAVREPSGDTKFDARRPQLDMANVFYHQGNLADPDLGLPRETFCQLAAEVDLILHSGGNRSFWDRYPAYRGANVQSTKTLVSMALPRKASIRFLSSDGVSVMIESPATDGTNGYVASKWVSERVLETTAKKFGVPIHIHRPMPAVSENPAAHEEALAELRRVTHDHHIRIPTDHVWGHIDLFQVDQLAGKVLGVMFSERTTIMDLGVEGVRVSQHHHHPLSYIHYQSPFRLTTEDLHSIWDAKAPDSPNTKNPSGPEWIGAVTAAGFPYIVSSQDLRIIGKDEDYVRFVSRRAAVVEGGINPGYEIRDADVPTDLASHAIGLCLRGTTVYGAILAFAAKSGEWLNMVGIDGLEHLGVQNAKARGCKVIAIGNQMEAMDTA